MQIMRMSRAPACTQMIERGDGAAAGREHRIDHQHEAAVEPARQLRVVLRGDRRDLVALQADVPDARVGHQLEHGVEHAEPGAQHRHDDDVGRDDAAVGRPERRLTHR